MPQPSVRPNVVVLLTEVDSTLRDDYSRLYRHDGTVLTDAEHDLVRTCTPEEISAANAHRELEDEWVRETNEIHKALVDLVTKYIDRLPDGSLCSDIYATMTDEDYAECDRLAKNIAARNGVEYPSEHDDS